MRAPIFLLALLTGGCSCGTPFFASSSSPAVPSSVSVTVQIPPANPCRCECATPGKNSTDGGIEQAH